MHQVIITIKPDGSVTVKAEGYQGPSCADVTRPFIDALGKRLIETPTPEMFQQTTQQQETHS